MARTEGEPRGVCRVLRALRAHLPVLWSTVASGFTLLIFLFAMLNYLFLRGTTAAGMIIGPAFYLSTVLFFVLVGLFRALKGVSALNATTYRLVHFLLTAVALYLCFFVLQPALVHALENPSGLLDDGSINWALIIIAYVLFTAAYFATVGLRMAVASARARRALREEEYRSMLKAKKN